MAKRSDTVETVVLALELMRRIPRQGRVSASQLQEQLAEAGVKRDLRTIQRQLDLLSGHFDIERDDRSKPYGYRWLERAEGLALPMLTAQESLLLTLAEQHLRDLLPSSLMKSMESFFAQARSNLGPHSKARREREWLSKVRVVSMTQPLIPPKVLPGVFEAVSNALFGNRWLHVDYKNADGKRQAPDVMPLGLAQQGPRLYLVCRYKGFNNERALALHRILAAKVSDLTFERPKDFDLKKYDDDGRFGMGVGRRIRLSFRIEASAGRHLLESPLSTDQQVLRDAGWFEVTATVVDTAQLEWWLSAFGDKVADVRRDEAPLRAPNAVEPT